VHVKREAFGLPFSFAAAKGLAGLCRLPHQERKNFAACRSSSLFFQTNILIIKEK
jgi:hypothetical protein